MLVRKIEDCREFATPCGETVREILHAERGDFSFRYSLTHTIVRTGQRSRTYRLKMSETAYILSGKGRVYINGESAEIAPGCAVYVPPMSRCSFENSGKEDLVFLSIVDPAFRPEQSELLD